MKESSYLIKTTLIIALLYLSTVSTSQTHQRVSEPEVSISKESSQPSEAHNLLKSDPSLDKLIKYVVRGSQKGYWKDSDFWKLQATLQKAYPDYVQEPFEIGKSYLNKKIKAFHLCKDVCKTFIKKSPLLTLSSKPEDFKKEKQNIVYRPPPLQRGYLPLYDHSHPS